MAGVLPITHIVVGTVSLRPSSSNIRTRRSRSIVISPCRVETSSRFPALSPPLQPCPQPFHRFTDIRRGARIAEADEAVPLHRIEIDAGRYGDTCFLQHAAGEIEAVVTKARHVGVKIEGAVHRQELVKSEERRV